MERTVSLELTPQDVIYTDSRTARMLRFFWGYPHRDRTKDFSGMDASDISPGSYVLVNWKKIDFVNKRFGSVRPKFYDHTPNNWRESLSIGEATLYWVSSEDQQ